MGEVPTNFRRPRSCALPQLGVLPSALVETLPAVCFAACRRGWAAWMPTRAAARSNEPSSHRRQPTASRAGAPRAQFWEKRGFPGAPWLVSSGLVVMVGNTVPPSAAPAPAVPAPGTPQLKTSLKVFGSASPPKGGLAGPAACFAQEASLQNRQVQKQLLHLKSGHKPLLHSAKPWLFCLHHYPLGTF